MIVSVHVLCGGKRSIGEIQLRYYEKEEMMTDGVRRINEHSYRLDSFVSLTMKRFMFVMLFSV